MFLENQQATAIETNAPPAILAISIPSKSINEEPSKRLVMNKGLIFRTKPVVPSKIEVAMKNPTKDQTLFFK